jgi:plasmid replication initiation protein
MPSTPRSAEFCPIPGCIRAPRNQAAVGARAAEGFPRARRRSRPAGPAGPDVVPVLSLSKAKRTTSVDYRAGDITIRVEGTTDHGIATIWDADVLIWAASQIIEARDAGIATSRLLIATPYEILGFIGRGTSGREYIGLKAALDRLQSTTVATSIRQPSSRRLHRFSWINEWKERATDEGRPLGLELIVPEWFYATTLDSSRILTLDRAYFALTGGIERWLYRLARKHAGKQPNGWRFEFRHLHARSGSLARYSDFAIDLRRIARTGSLPGYRVGDKL